LQTIRAEDNGGKFSTATLNVEVADANDQAPEFVDHPYSFKVKEGLAGITVGTVKAKDEDVGRNAKIFYQVALFDSFILLSHCIAWLNGCPKFFYSCKQC
jgi:protocadherin-15